MQPTLDTPSRRPCHGAEDFLTLLLQMSTLYSTEGAPGHSWKLTRAPGGIVLWIPARGKQSRPKKLLVNETDPAKWAAKIIEVEVDLVPKVLLDALLQAGD